MERDHLWVTDDEHNSTIHTPKQAGSKTKNTVIYVKLTSTGGVLVSYIQLLTVLVRQFWVSLILVIDSIDSGTCLIRSTKGPGKSVELDRMSENVYLLLT